MAAGPQIVVEYVAKTDKLAGATQQVGLAATKTGKLARKAFLPAVGALAAIGLASQRATDAASALNEQIAASTQVFGAHAKGVQAWSKTGAKAFGLSETQALRAANAYGNMLSTVGLGAKDVTSMSKAMVQLAGDMASFHDQDPTEMLDKLRSGLSGEAEPLRKFGVLISEARVKAFAYQNGIAKAGATLTEAQKVQARYGVIMQDSVKAQGDFARTSDSVANRQRTVAAETENVSAQFGQALLPVTKTVLSVVSSLLGFFGRYPAILKILVVAIGAVAAAVVVMNVALAVTAVVASPVALTVLAIVAAFIALIAIIVLVVKNWDTIVGAMDRGWKAIKGAAQAVFDWIRSNWPLLVGILAGPFGLAIALIVTHWNAIKNAASSALGVVRSLLGSFAGWIAGVARQITAPLGWIADALGAIGDAAVAAVGVVKKQIGNLAQWILDVVGSVRSAASAVAGAIKGPLNAVIGAWNNLRIPGFKVNINMPGPIPDIKFGWGGVGLPDIPTLARGGVVSSPTLALVGEGRGREIVTPEALLRSIVGELAPDVRVFIGDEELRSMVRYEVRQANDRTAQTLLAGLR